MLLSKFQTRRMLTCATEVFGDIRPSAPKGEVKSFPFNGPPDWMRNYSIEPRLLSIGAGDERVYPAVEVMRRHVMSFKWFGLFGGIQNGKSTCLKQLAKTLETEGFLCLYLSLQTIYMSDDPSKYTDFDEQLRNQLSLSIRESQSLGKIEEFDLEQVLCDLEEDPRCAGSQFTSLLSAVASSLPKNASFETRDHRPLVLLIDDVDHVQDMWVKRLLGGQLGAMYHSNQPIPQSVIVSGTRDMSRVVDDVGAPFHPVSTRVRPIRWDAAMLRGQVQQHADAAGVTIPGDVVSEIFRLTNGHPWLCNYLLEGVCCSGGEVVERPNVASIDVIKELMLRDRVSYVFTLQCLYRNDERIQRVYRSLIGGPSCSQQDHAFAMDCDVIILTEEGARFSSPFVEEVLTRMVDVSDPEADFYRFFREDDDRPDWLGLIESAVHRSVLPTVAAATSGDDVHPRKKVEALSDMQSQFFQALVDAVCHVVLLGDGSTECTDNHWMWTRDSADKLWGCVVQEKYIPPRRRGQWPIDEAMQKAMEQAVGQVKSALEEREEVQEGIAMVFVASLEDLEEDEDVWNVVDIKELEDGRRITCVLVRISI